MLGCIKPNRDESTSKPDNGGQTDIAGSKETDPLKSPNNSTAEQTNTTNDEKNPENNSGNNSNTKKCCKCWHEWIEFVKGDIFDTRKHKLMKEVVDEILEEATDGEDFDIFQMCAFYEGKKEYRPYYVMSFIKAVLCLLSQLFMLVYILYDLLINHERDFCNLDTEIWNKLVSVALAFFAGFYFAEEFDNVDNGGMYSINLKNFENCPIFISPIWLAIGKYYNLLLALAAWIGSYIVIFVSYDIFDLVLNSLALFWVIELDDLLTRTHDYTKVKKYIKKNKDKRNDHPEPKTENKDYCNNKCCVPKNKCCNMSNNRELTHEPGHVLLAKPNHKSHGCNCCVNFLELFVVFFRFVVFFLKFLIPILIGICT